MDRRSFQIRSARIFVCYISLENETRFDRREGVAAAAKTAGAEKARLCYSVLDDVLISVIPCDRCETYFGAGGATRLRTGYGVVRRQVDYLAASELTMFSKRGSPRSGSQKGSSFN